MLTTLLDPVTQKPRTPMFWVVLGGMIVVQLMAFWLLCSLQVDKAEARDFDTHLQKIALADCLQNIPGATLATCDGRADGGPALSPAGGIAQVAYQAPPVPASYVLR